MAKKVAQYAHVTNRETGETVVLEPGQTDYPEWVSKQVDNPAVFEGGDELPEDEPVVGSALGAPGQDVEARRERAREASRASRERAQAEKASTAPKSDTAPSGAEAGQKRDARDGDGRK